MNTEVWTRAQVIFNAVIELSPEERPLVVERMSSGDRLLADTVWAMLHEDERGQPLLDCDLSELARSALLPESAPSQIGPYRLQRVLGEGGMGVVYLAERADIGGLAAIKLLRHAWMSPLRRQRFALEERVLANLRHPHIAQIYDANRLADGTPWFVMEYAEGLPITTWVRDHNGGTRGTLLLFRQVCDAVHYAHTHAIIHRDLKPSNILVTDTGGVKLLDFGIAKLLEQDRPTDRTVDGLLPMTPAYAAPEQLNGGPVGAFTDVYALGVLLYELLTGELPDRSRNSPRKPSSLAVLKPVPRIRASRHEWAELDVLCLTALQELPERRYRSVDALISDLDAYLDGKPLQARPDSSWYRSTKFARRHRAVLLSVAVAMLALVCVTLVFTIRLARARDAAVAEATRTNRLQRFTENLFDGGDPSAGPPSNLTTSVLLQRGQTEAESLRDDARMQADMFATLGGAYHHLGYLDRASTLLERAMQARRDHFGTSNGEYAESTYLLGLLRKDQGRMDEAEQLLRRSLATARKTASNDETLARYLCGLGSVLNLRGRYAESKTVLQEAVQRSQRLGRQTIEFADSLSQLADAHFYEDEYKPASALNQQALAVYRNLFGNSHPSVAHTLDSIGNIAQNEGHFIEAEALFRQSLAINEKWYGLDHPEIAVGLTSLAKAQSSLGKYDDAKRSLVRALELERKVYGENHSRVAWTLNDLGVLAYTRDRYDEAEAEWREALTIWRKVYGEQHQFVGVGYGNLAGVYLRRKDYRNAELMARKALAVYAAALPKDHVNVAVMHVKLGRILLQQHQYAEAEPETLAGFRYFSKHETQYQSYAAAAKKDLAEIESQLQSRR